MKFCAAKVLPMDWLPVRLFSPTNCGREDQNREYLIVSAVRGPQSDAYESITLSLKQANPIFRRIPRLTPSNNAGLIAHKPQASGAGSANRDSGYGASGDEIHTDQYGRVKCQFHWDRCSETNQNGSCWIRVAGLGWQKVGEPCICPGSAMK
ncbi:MAG: hypothetical protein IPL99_03930 [Candidatus Competibacteraceae bacterium]|nr:hypothetical protein [Candidatus Competibacteraceae bacterium]